MALSNEGKTDEAIAKFNEVIAAVPNCAECYANIGTVQGMAKKYDEAEAAYKKAIELKPDFAEAYNGLANVYNAAKKFDLAAEASKKAMELIGAPAAGAAGARRRRRGAPSASQMFNQGVILWNAGKIPEAKAQFEAAVKADPNMADARYWLGMSLVNAGTPEAMKEAKPHFEAYLKLAPTGASTSRRPKAIVASIKLSERHRRQPRGDPATDRRGGCRARGGSPRTSRLLAVSKTFERRPRPGRLRGRPARLRREQSPGSPAENRRNGRIRDQVAPDRPPPVEQGQEGGPRFRGHPCD